MTSDPIKIAQLDEWMKGKEGENLEFKEAKGGFHFESLCKYCCAVANEGGGQIVLGVTDTRPRRVVGTQAFDQPERTRKGLCERIPLAFDFEEIHHPDCSPDSRVLVFHVPSRPVGTPIKYDGRYWMRQEDSLVEMSEDKLREIFAESGHDFSADICEGLALDQLDLAAIEDFRRRWIDKANKAEDRRLAGRLASLSPEQLLTDVGAMTDAKLTYAALILFGTAQAVGWHLAQAEVIFEYRSSDASGPAQDREEYRRGFFAFYDDPRNRRIAEIFTRCGLVERSGQGMNLIYEEMIKRSLLNTLRRRKEAHSVGRSRGTRWYPGPKPEGGARMKNVLYRALPQPGCCSEVLLSEQLALRARSWPCAKHWQKRALRSGNQGIRVNPDI